MRALARALLLAAPVSVSAQEVTTGQGAILRGLDKLNAVTQDFTLTGGASDQLGPLEITLGECRYPSGNATGEAYAFVTVREAGIAQPVFRGWMVASSPALNPMDHPRYDIWVLRCTTS